MVDVWTFEKNYPGVGAFGGSRPGGINSTGPGTPQIEEGQSSRVNE